VQSKNTLIVNVSTVDLLMNLMNSLLITSVLVVMADQLLHQTLYPPVRSAIRLKAVTTGSNG
jgi:hypothetical protein